MLCCARDPKVSPAALIEHLASRAKNKHTMSYYLFVKKAEKARLTAEEKALVAEGKKYWDSLQSTATDLALEIPPMPVFDRKRSLASRFSSSLEGARTPQRDQTIFPRLQQDALRGSVGPLAGHSKLHQQQQGQGQAQGQARLNFSLEQSRSFRSKSKPNQESLLEHEESPIFST